MSAGGCVRFYQPMSGLHRPVVVDPRQPNFDDVHLVVRCVPGDHLSAQHAGNLCDRVGALFENQGARVETVIGTGVREEAGFEDPPREGEAAAPRADLVLELRSRLVHESNHPLSWVVSVVSFTVLPAVTEFSFAQDVVVRDGTGFPLVTDSLEGRVITRFGAGPWVGNALLDLARPKAEKVGADAAGRDLSSDLYRQLSQLVFNAKIHDQVLRESAPPMGEP